MSRTSKRERKYKFNKGALRIEHPGWLEKYEWEG